MEQQIPTYSIESLRASSTESNDIELFRFEYFAKDLEHLKAPHRHQFYTLILVTQGNGSHSIDFEIHLLQAGRLFIISPQQVHSWISINDVKGYVLLFNDSFVAVASGRRMDGAWTLFRSNHPNFIDLIPNELRFWMDEFLFMEIELNTRDEYTRESLYYSIGSLLVRASRLTQSFASTSLNVGQDFLYNFQEMIEENFMNLKTPKDYASKMNITPNYLNALCKRKSGKSAGELIRQRILLEAKRLLAHTQLSASEIAFMLNFNDNSYFGRFFKKATGYTPEEFRSKQLM